VCDRSRVERKWNEGAALHCRERGGRCCIAGREEEGGVAF